MKFFPGILLIFIMQIGHAQFQGGAGSGNHIALAGQINCYEDQLYAAFRGGHSDGFETTAIIRNNCLDKLYTAFSGGNGDGATWNLVQQSICTGSYLLEGKLLNWEAQCRKKEVVLSWTMLSETNNELFQIERSIDGNRWQQLGRVKAIGKSRQPQHYSLEYPEVLKGPSFYRMQLFMRDGSFEYSPVISLECEKGEAFLLFIYPNPTNGQLTISGYGAHANLWIYNLAGQHILKTTIVNDTAELNLTQLENGIYLVRVNSDNKIVNRKFIIQH